MEVQVPPQPTCGRFQENKGWAITLKTSSKNRFCSGCIPDDVQIPAKRRRKQKCPLTTLTKNISKCMKRNGATGIPKTRLQGSPDHCGGGTIIFGHVPSHVQDTADAKESAEELKSGLPCFLTPCTGPSRCGARGTSPLEMSCTRMQSVPLLKIYRACPCAVWLGIGHSNTAWWRAGRRQGSGRRIQVCMYVSRGGESQ